MSYNRPDIDRQSFETEAEAKRAANDGLNPVIIHNTKTKLYDWLPAGYPLDRNEIVMSTFGFGKWRATGASELDYI